MNPLLALLSRRHAAHFDLQRDHRARGPTRLRLHMASLVCAVKDSDLLISCSTLKHLPTWADVRFTHVQRTSECRLWANSGLKQCSKEDRYSITSLARASSEGGTVMPSTFAVLRLMTSSSLVGNSIGKWATGVPLSILYTYVAAR